MPYRLLTDEPLAAGVLRVADEQLARAAASLTCPGLSPEAAVHQARKHFKKLRSLLRLVRDALGPLYAEENARFRDLGRGLAPVRDADALIEQFDALVGYSPSSPVLGSIRAALVDEREVIDGEHADLDAQIPEILIQLRDARRRVAGWPVESVDATIVARGFARACRRGRRRMKAALAGRTVEQFHEWRKRVKDLWYHTRLLQAVHPRKLRKRRRLLRRLAESLGEDHDLAMLERKLRDHPDRYGRPQDIRVLLGLVIHRRNRLQARSETLGRRAHQACPNSLAKRIHCRWPT